MDTNASFGLWLRRRRKALDLTQADLARRVGCAEVTIRKIEADERRPSRQIATRMADMLALALQDRVAFLKAALGEVGVDRLAPPEQTHADLPTGTVTFFFTDIEGSTRLWEQHPAAMRSALTRHDAILRHAIAAHKGIVFKTLGDGICAAFAHAPDALATALETQQTFLQGDWGPLGPVRVRMAVHTGSAKVHDADYVGPPLNRVAHLLTAGHGGQVLISRATQELVCDHLPPDVELRDLGTHRLKGLTRPERIFQVFVPGLPTTFPPLRALAAHQHNLPFPPTPLIGQEREVTHVCALLRQEDVRLVTLTGPGGIGKTRLALQVATELLDDFGDGVWFVNLAPITDPTLVASTVAQTLGIKETGNQPLMEQLKIALLAKQLLLLLDNFEQVLDAALVVAELLGAVAGLKVLVTSRSVLHLSAEHTFPVPPLALPDLQRLPSLERLKQYDAVQLFIARSQASKPAFTITNANALAVAEICYRLDGLPLAIELAAARTKLFSPETLLKRLHRRLPLLTGGPRDLPARQQTLRNTIDWSYHLLDAGTQRLFWRLAVLVGGCTIEAAEAVCNTQHDLPFDVLDGLAALADQSLVRQIDEPSGEPRFIMLETIREYALEELERSGEEEVIRGRHRDWFLWLAEAAAQQFEGPEQVVWLDWMEVEHDNLRAALEWCQAEAASTEEGLRLAGALSWFWSIRGYISEGRVWLAGALARLEAAEPTAARAKALLGAGDMAYRQSDYVMASALWEESLAISRILRDKRGIAASLDCLKFIAWAQGKYERAVSIHNERLDLYREHGDEQDISESPMDFGLVTFWQGDYEQAVALFEKRLNESREMGNKVGIATALYNLGEAARAQGDYGWAAALHQESLDLCREVRDKEGIAIVLISVGYIAQHQGSSERAAAHFAEGLALHREFGDQNGIAHCLAGLAGTFVVAERPEQAVRLFGAAEVLLETIGARMAPVYRAEYERNVATVRAQLDKATFAAAWAAGRALPLEQAIAEALGEGTASPNPQQARGQH